MGELGPATHLVLPPRRGYRRHTRAGFEPLHRLAERWAEDPSLRRELAYRPSSSLYRAGVIGARENGLLHFHDLIRDAIPATAIDDEDEGVRALAAGAPA